MDIDAAQRTALGMLLDKHPQLLDLEELRAVLDDVPVDGAVADLVDDGLATRIGDRVGASRAAVRGAQLAA